MVEPATRRVRTGAFGVRVLPAQRTRIDAQARVVPGRFKNSPSALSATGETAVQNTVFHNPFARRVASLPNRAFDAMDMARDASLIGIGLLNELKDIQIKSLVARQPGLGWPARSQSWLDNAFIDLSRITQTKPSSAWAVAPGVQSLLFSGVALSDMVFQRVAGSAASETAALSQISTTHLAAVDVAQTFEHARQDHLVSGLQVNAMPAHKPGDF